MRFTLNTTSEKERQFADIVAAFARGYFPGCLIVHNGDKLEVVTEEGTEVG